MKDSLALLDYRRRVAEMYARARLAPDLEAGCAEFRRQRDELFRTHPQSALSDEQRGAFTGLRYFPYDPSLRFELPVDVRVDPVRVEIALRDDGVLRLRRAGRVRFAVGGREATLSLFWIEGYGGGLFLAFKDLTSAETTYQGGRYLLDTIKGADLGSAGSSLIVDFNFAYNPSCAYNSRWSCPLAPEENHLPVAIQAGEMRFAGVVPDEHARPRPQEVRR